MSEARNIKVRLPFGVGVAHFVGIGGIGMSGIAEVMQNLGYDVRGSDVADQTPFHTLLDMNGGKIKVCGTHNAYR